MDARFIQETKTYTFDLIQKVNPLIYKIKDSTNKEHLGLISQELQLIEPLLVKKNSHGLLEVNYERLSILLISVVKQLEERVSILENNQKIKVPAKKK